MKSTSNGLLRLLTLKDAVAVGLGAIIGAGIFVVLGVAAGVAGPAFLIGLLLAGVMAACNGLSAAQLAAVYPNSGGTYEYGHQLLNPAFGFAAGWMFLISKLAAGGVVAIGFGHYFYQLFPELSPNTYAVIAVVLLTVVNCFGIKKAGLLNLIIVATTILALLYFIFSAAPHVKAENFKPFNPFGISGIAEAAALLFFAFTGYARIATLAEEVVEPRTTIPKAIVITITCAILLYLAIAIVATGVTGTANLASSKSPLQFVAHSLQAKGLQTIITIGASTAMLGVLLSQIMGISRMLLAMGRRHDLPTIFQKLSNTYSVPVRAILFTGLVILLLTVFGSFDFVLRTASFTILLYYSITNVAALKQPKYDQLYPKLIPALGLVGCLAMSLALPFTVILSGLLLLALGFLVRWVLHQIYHAELKKINSLNNPKNDGP